MINIGKTCLKEPNFLIGIIIQSSTLKRQMSIELFKVASLISWGSLTDYLNFN